MNLSLLIPLPPDYRAHKRQELRILLGVLIGELLTELFPPELLEGLEDFGIRREGKGQCSHARSLNDLPAYAVYLLVTKPNFLSL